MRLRFKSILSLLFILIIATAAIGIGYFFYKDSKDNSRIIVDSGLTINYLDGDYFKFNNDNDIKISVTNNSKKSKYYYLKFSNIKAKKVKYLVKSSEKLSLEGELKSEIILNNLEIESGKTIDYTISFINESKEDYSGNVVLSSVIQENSIFMDSILANNKVSNVVITKLGEESEIDEGLISTKDDDGDAYFFRGDVANNNVSFADLNWKIIKINGDGSVKLVLDGILEEYSQYYDEDYKFDKSIINKKLNNWFNDYLKEYSDYIVYYKYCNDYVFENDEETYISYTRLSKNRIPTYTCLGNNLNLKVGLLTADEVMLAGGGFSNNKKYFLYNEDISSPYYTMTSAEYKNDTYYPYVVDKSGKLVENTAGDLLRGVRPVINIIKNAKVTGTGTNDDPYKILSN